MLICEMFFFFFFTTLRGKWKVSSAVSNEENNTNKTLMGSLFLLIIAVINKISLNICVTLKKKKNHIL